MAHVSQSPAVSAGMEVVAWQTIGKVGRSGKASGDDPRLHYAIGTNAGTIDAMPWLEPPHMGVDGIRRSHRRLLVSGSLSCTEVL